MPVRLCGTYAHQVRSGWSKGNEAAARCLSFSVERNVRAGTANGDVSATDAPPAGAGAGAWAPQPRSAPASTAGNRPDDLNRVYVRGFAMELDWEGKRSNALKLMRR